METLSWFCNDRDVPGYNRYFVSARLLATRERLQAVATEIADQADQAGAALVATARIRCSTDRSKTGAGAHRSAVS